MIAKILVGLSICIGLIVALITILQLLGFIYIALNNLFSSSWVHNNDFQNRMIYGGKLTLILIYIAFMLFLSFMIGSEIIQ